MAVPKRRTTKSKRNMRRMHIFIKEPTLVTCDKCKEQKLPHTVCSHCGYYKGREVIDVLKQDKKSSDKKSSDKKKTEEKEQPIGMGNMSKKK